MTDFAAIDLGAESGRVVRGSFDGERIALEVAHRFQNRPVRLPDGLHWNLLALFTEAVDGLRGLDVPCAASASTRGASTTPCWIGGAACSGCRSTTATRAPTA